MRAEDLPARVAALLHAAEAVRYEVRWKNVQNKSLKHKGVQYGGWNSVSKHWYVVDSAVGDKFRDLLLRHDFVLKRRQSGYGHWQRAGEDATDDFRAVVVKLTGVSIPLSR